MLLFLLSILFVSHSTEDHYCDYKEGRITYCSDVIFVSKKAIDTGSIWL